MVHITYRKIEQKSEYSAVENLEGKLKSAKLKANRKPACWKSDRIKWLVGLAALVIGSLTYTDFQKKMILKPCKDALEKMNKITLIVTKYQNQLSDFTSRSNDIVEQTNLKLTNGAMNTINNLVPFNDELENLSNYTDRKLRYMDELKIGQEERDEVISDLEDTKEDIEKEYSDAVDAEERRWELVFQDIDSQNQALTKAFVLESQRTVRELRNGLDELKELEKSCDATLSGFNGLSTTKLKISREEFYRGIEHAIEAADRYSKE